MPNIVKAALELYIANFSLIKGRVMSLLAGAITHGQAVTLVLLCIFLIIFIIVDIYLVLSLHRKNIKLAKSNEIDSDRTNDETYNDKGEDK